MVVVVVVVVAVLRWVQDQQETGQALMMAAIVPFQGHDFPRPHLLSGRQLQPEGFLQLDRRLGAQGLPDAGGVNVMWVQEGGKSGNPK